MVHDIDVISTALSWLEAGQGAALVFVVRTVGSSPRPVGSIAAVSESADFVGSVSGGCLEGAVVDRALESIGKRKPERVSFTIGDSQAFDVGLTCGGTLDVLIVPIKNPVDIINLHDLVKGRIPACLIVNMERGAITLLGDGNTSKMADIDGTLRANVLNILAQRGPAAMVNGPDGEVFIRPFYPNHRLVIVGGTHIAQFLGPMAVLAGFDVTVIDPREAFASEMRFADIPHYVLWPDTYFEQAPLDRETAVVSLAHDPKIDDPALTAALRSEAFYIGALGSSRTHQKRRKRLRDEGIEDVLIDRIHAPVGLSIGGHSASDIAISILGELVQVRNAEKPTINLDQTSIAS